MTALALLFGLLVVLFLAAVVVLILRWVDRVNNAPYPAEINEDEYR